MSELKAPFPRFGGKGRAASMMWARLGDPTNLVIPFFGSGAELWARPSEPRIETVNDIDHHLANFFRALKHAPDEVAYWADSPVNEADLHARHLWLVTRVGFRERMKVDPTYFDAQAAGWWVWGACAWIGSGWCAKDLARQRGNGGPPIQLPHLGNAGMGVHRKLPHLGDAGRGGPLPDLGASDGAAWGRGLHSRDATGNIASLLGALSVRLRRVRVACGDFERVLSDCVTWRHELTAVILDPEYPDGVQGLYGSHNTDEEHVWYRAARWAEQHGDRPDMRICLCGYDGTWTPPAGWTTVAWKARGGYGSQRRDGDNENAARERLWFSPHCIRVDERPAQASLFDLSPKTTLANVPEAGQP